MSTDSAAAAPDRLTPAARRSILGGVITLFIDSYDIYLPALVLPAALGYFEPASMSTATKATLDTLVFTVTLLGRPIGGPIFGNLSDRIGRKRVALITGAAGYSTAYTFGLILPGLYTVWVKGLAHIVPFAYTALFLIPLGGALVLLAAHRGPETLNAPLLRERGAVGEAPEPAAVRVGRRVRQPVGARPT